MIHRIAKPAAILALVLTIGPAVLFLFDGLQAESSSGAVSEGVVKGLMVAGTVLWFAAAPHWLREDD